VLFKGLLLVAIVNDQDFSKAILGGFLVIKVVPDKAPFGICGKELDCFVRDSLSGRCHLSKGFRADGPRDEGLGKLKA
jgi:hypothetical protein